MVTPFRKSSFTTSIRSNSQGPDSSTSPSDQPTLGRSSSRVRRLDSRASNIVVSSRGSTHGSISNSQTVRSSSVDAVGKRDAQIPLSRSKLAAGSIIEGRVTVYTTTGCQESEQVFTKLESYNLRYSDINLDVFCERRDELLDRCGTDTTPQVFFNHHHLGNYAEMLELEATGELAEEVAFVKKTKPTPKTPALATDFLFRNSLSRLDPFDGDGSPEVQDSFALLVRDIKEANLVKDRTYHLRTYKACFIGSELVNWLVMAKDMSRPDAVEAGQALVKQHYMHHVCHEHDFKDDKLFYRLLEDEPTEALNTFMTCDLQPRPARVLAEVMRRKILGLYDLFLSPDGKAVDYEAMGHSEAFMQYSQLSCELQRCDVANLDDRQRTAFFINIYNVLVMHATTQFDSPKTAWDRFKFFNSISYMIGGLEYSLSGIENGVLRANKRAPNQVHRPFQKTDPRLRMCLPACDPRIHFAIVCGARSCPPIKVYSAEELDEQLDVAVAAFLDDGGIFVDPEKHEIHLSRIFQWYQSDFADTKYELLKWIIKYMPPGDMCRKLFNIVRTLNYKIVFQSYDWAPNAK